MKHMENTFNTYLDKYVITGSTPFNVFFADFAERERKARIERMNSLPIQIVPVEFSDRDRYKYNIDDRECSTYFNIVRKDSGEKLIDRTVFVTPMDNMTFIEKLNSNERFMIIRTVHIGKYTKDEKKEYKYLKGDYRYETRYAVLDKEKWEVIWESDKRFGDSPSIYTNVMYIDKEYTFLPTMESLYKVDSYSVFDRIETANHIILGNKYGDDTAVVIDKHTGGITKID